MSDALQNSLIHNPSSEVLKKPLSNQANLAAEKQKILLESLYQMPPCVICLGDLSQGLVALKCGHVYHEKCVEESLVLRARCPICKFLVGQQFFYNIPQKYIKLYFGPSTRKHFIVNLDKNIVSQPQLVVDSWIKNYANLCEAYDQLKNKYLRCQYKFQYDQILSSKNDQLRLKLQETNNELREEIKKSNKIQEEKQTQRRKLQTRIYDEQQLRKKEQQNYQREKKMAERQFNMQLKQITLQKQKKLKLIVQDKEKEINMWKDKAVQMERQRDQKQKQLAKTIKQKQDIQAICKISLRQQQVTLKILFDNDMQDMIYKKNTQIFTLRRESQKQISAIQHEFEQKIKKQNKKHKQKIENLLNLHEEEFGNLKQQYEVNIKNLTTQNYRQQQKLKQQNKLQLQRIIQKYRLEIEQITKGNNQLVQQLKSKHESEMKAKDQQHDLKITKLNEQKILLIKNTINQHQCEIQKITHQHLQQINNLKTQFQQKINTKQQAHIEQIKILTQQKKHQALNKIQQETKRYFLEYEKWKSAKENILNENLAFMNEVYSILRIFKQLSKPTEFTIRKSESIDRNAQPLDKSNEYQQKTLQQTPQKAEQKRTFNKDQLTQYYKTIIDEFTQILQIQVKNNSQQKNRQNVLIRQIQSKSMEIDYLRRQLSNVARENRSKEKMISNFQQKMSLFKCRLGRQGLNSTIKESQGINNKTMEAKQIDMSRTKSADRR